MWVRSILAVLAVAVLSGCGVDAPDHNAPGVKPTAHVLGEMRASPFPVYWLGQSFHGLALSSVEITNDQASANYGAYSCDSGCGFPLTVVSSVRGRGVFPRKHIRPADWPQVCFAPAQGALLMGCDGETGYDLLTGRSDIQFQIAAPGIDSSDVVRSLRPTSRVAAPGSRYEPPERMNCATYASLPKWFSSKVPPSLRPVRCR